MNKETIESAYSIANETYAQYGVDTEQAILRLGKTPISIHCWQGDDVAGFEHAGALDGGLVATGHYPGKARNADELRSDLSKAMSLAPGNHRVNLHAIYAETNGRKVDRTEITFEHFSRWADWAAGKSIGLDFNPSFFAHPKAASGLTIFQTRPNTTLASSEPRPSAAL
jgi:L-rhamnose isomerase